jgi:hypothetical protein
MKKYKMSLVFLVTLITSLASAENSSADQTVQLIRHPEIVNNVPFSSRSNQNGVCIALGYEMAARGTAVSVPVMRSAVTVNAQGNIVGGTYQEEALANLVCVNKVGFPKWTGKLFRHPRHPNSVRFSSQSDQNGACTALGYERGAPGSATRADNYHNAAVTVNSQGLVIGGTYSDMALVELVCVNSNTN